MARHLPIPMPPLLSVEGADNHISHVIDYYVQRLQGLSSVDAYRSHTRADDLLCDFLWEVGMGEVADAYLSAKSQSRFSY